MNKTKAITDRRYQRTHELIIRSAIELAERNGWEKVSVTKLAEKANINRNSFYIHFNTINDVFDEIEKEVVSKYRDFLRSSSLDKMLKDERFVNSFYCLLEDEKDHAAVIAKTGRAEHLLYKLQKEWTRFYDQAISDLNRHFKGKDILLPYLSGTTYILFSAWVNDPFGFDFQKNMLFNREVINHLLKFAEKNDVG